MWCGILQTPWSSDLLCYFHLETSQGANAPEFEAAEIPSSPERQECFVTNKEEVGYSTDFMSEEAIGLQVSGQIFGQNVVVYLFLGCTVVGKGPGFSSFKSTKYCCFDVPGRICGPGNPTQARGYATCFRVHSGSKQLVWSCVGFHMWRQIFLLYVDDGGNEVTELGVHNLPGASCIVDCHTLSTALRLRRLWTLFGFVSCGQLMFGYFSWTLNLNSGIFKLLVPADEGTTGLEFSQFLMFVLILLVSDAISAVFDWSA
ncbi:hypothetical protein Cgig2_030865 [Carnegiea gigantea]|uniref:Uncharacterized protein n=1 Tax=Carnegiea gigantea TaxID=171969 RepID=A0A9Q1QI61_9CARY|nr:hypothetical protein Cgig2_030865 [Carnegiea gigantea]